MYCKTIRLAFSYTIRTTWNDGMSKIRLWGTGIMKNGCGFGCAACIGIRRTVRSNKKCNRITID